MEALDEGIQAETKQGRGNDGWLDSNRLLEVHPGYLTELKPLLSKKLQASVYHFRVIKAPSVLGDFL